MITANRLSPIGPAVPGRRTMWRYACSCGVTVESRRSKVESGHIRSCGCLRRDATAEHNRNRDYGITLSLDEPLMHGAWRGMLSRCRNKSDKNFSDYGGRGILVCERWLVFANFLADMGRRPSAAHTLEREDNSRGYEPGNCKWATRAEQARNRRANRLFTIDGETLCLIDWAARANKHPETITYRIKRGWDPIKAIITPSSRPRKTA